MVEVCALHDSPIRCCLPPTVLRLLCAPVVERDSAKRLPATFRNVVKALELHTEGMNRYQVFGLRNR